MKDEDKKKFKDSIKVKDKNVKLLLLDKLFSQSFYISQREDKIKDELSNMTLLLITFLIMFGLSLIDLLINIDWEVWLNHSFKIVLITFILGAIVILSILYKRRKKELNSFYAVWHYHGYYEHLLNSLDKDWYVNLKPLYYKKSGIMPQLIHDLVTKEQLEKNIRLQK